PAPLAGRARDRHGPALPFDSSADRVDDAPPPVGRSVRIEPLASVAHERSDGLRLTLDVVRDLVRSRVTSGVRRRLAARVDDGARSFVYRAVSDDDGLDGDFVRFLYLVAHRLHLRL